MNIIKKWSCIAAMVAVSGMSFAEIAWLDEMRGERIEQGWGRPHTRQSVEGNPLRVGGTEYKRGIGTHSAASIRIRLDGQADRFTAKVGVDDEVGDKGSIRLVVYGDKTVLFESNLLEGGDPAQDVNVDLGGVKQLLIIVNDGGNGMDYDHADLCDAMISYHGAKPEIVEMPVEQPYILTPPAPPTPRINGA
ncbi:MAG: NPCBM/NEW2 domain-containing protein, partial [Pontiellaceae bacterium]|nr:NPCBM/NEW2 domain-containing protein [Pontiellaceae bacterium]